MKDESGEQSRRQRTTIPDTSSQDTKLEPKSRKIQLATAGLLGFVLIVAIIYLLPAFDRWQSADRSVSIERIRLATVSRGDLTRDIPLQARVVAAVSPTLYARSEGMVLFNAEVGDVVKKDDVVAEIDNHFLKIELSRVEFLFAQHDANVERVEIQSRQTQLANQRNLDQATIQVTAARREANRAEASFKDHAISEFDYQKAMDELQSAEFALEHATGFLELDKERLEFEIKTQKLIRDQQALALEDARRRLEQLQIRAPMDGTVGNRFVEHATFVQPGSPVVSIVNLSQFELEAPVPETYASELEVGIEAEVQRGEDVIGARLTAISPEVANNQVNIRLRFIGRTPEGLRQNQRLTGRLLLENVPDAVQVARGQFLETGGGRIAYVVQDGLAVRQQIEVGARSLNTVQILRGLEPGEQIVVSGTDLFQDAETVYLRR